MEELLKFRPAGRLDSVVLEGCEVLGVSTGVNGSQFFR